MYIYIYIGPEVGRLLAHGDLLLHHPLLGLLPQHLIVLVVLICVVVMVFVML